MPDLSGVDLSAAACSMSLFESLFHACDRSSSASISADQALAVASEMRIACCDLSVNFSENVIAILVGIRICHWNRVSAFEPS